MESVSPSLSASRPPLSKKKAGRGWVEVVPHGLVGGMVPQLCLMVFKEKKGLRRFAVPLSPIQGQISLEQSLHREEPFRFAADLFEAMKVKMQKCYFLKNHGSFATVQIHFSGHPHLSSVTLKAGDVIPFAMYSGLRFFCTPSFFTEMLDQKMEPSTLKKQSLKKPLYIN